jgi:two-component system CheB/CheR fusion protein
MGISAGVVTEFDDLGDWGLLTTDASLVVTGWNRWLERHTGLPESAVLTRGLFDIFPDLDRRKFEGFYRQALSGQTVVLSQRFHRYLLPMPPSYPGTGFDRMQQTARIIPLVSAGAVCGTVTVIEDVTERVAHEVELAKRVEELQEADRRKDEFLAMLAHELRNPLAPIGNAARILRHPAGEVATHVWCGEVIERQVAHLGRLVDDLLDVARVSRGKITLQLSSVVLATAVGAAVEAVRPLYDTRQQKLIVSLPDHPIRLTADASRLTQILVNLLNNASKYSPESSQVQLTAESVSGRVTIRVKDNGAGIPREMLTKVFDLFTQSDRTLDRSQGGLGIGLTLVHRLVLLHGGTVEARSEGPGHGSEFVVRLPAAADPNQNSAPESAAHHRDHRKVRALVVDDNKDAAASLALLLALAGHEVHTAQDGWSAVRAVEEFRPEVVFCDIGLPGLDGYGVARACRAKFSPAEMVLIAASGYGQEEDRRKSREAGFDHHIVKPFEYQAISRLLESF